MAFRHHPEGHKLHSLDLTYSEALAVLLFRCCQTFTDPMIRVRTTQNTIMKDRSGRLPIRTMMLELIVIIIIRIIIVVIIVFEELFVLVLSRLLDFLLFLRSLEHLVLTSLTHARDAMFLL